MKLKIRQPLRSTIKAKRVARGTRAHLPSFAEAAKRVAGMMEGSFDLSMREGFGPKLLR